MCKVEIPFAQTTDQLPDHAHTLRSAPPRQADQGPFDMEEE